MIETAKDNVLYLHLIVGSHDYEIYLFLRH